MLTQGVVIDILRDAIWTVIIAAGPMLVVAIAVGLLVSIFQATTQINEQTLSFVPKVIAVLLTLVISGGLIFATVGGFVTRLFQNINAILG